MEGSIRVGRCLYNRSGQITYPSFPGYTNVVVMMRSHSPWHDLSPYQMTDSNGVIFENCWQFSKAYRRVRKSVQRYSRYNSQIIWDHPAETHTNSQGFLTPEYFAWRNKGMRNQYAVRYPVGYKYRHECVCAFATNPDGTLSEPLDYIASIKRIYVPIYCQLAKITNSYHTLKQRLEAGENLLIIEVDGPHQESLGYYQQTYGVSEDFITYHTMLVTVENIQIMLNDPKHPFGHGYCLAIALLDNKEG